MNVGNRTRTAVVIGLFCTTGPVAAPGAALAAAPAAVAAAPLPTVNGSGSTFAQVAINQWTADVTRKFGLRINYQGAGSTAGRERFALRQMDFASSDVSYGFPAGMGNETKPSFPYTYMPLVAGGTAMLYNVEDKAGRPINDLQLSGKLVVKLFTQPFFSEYLKQGDTFWDDPAILAENPHLRGRLPHTRVRPVTRVGGSGTTSVFTEYLSKQDPGRWRSYMEGGNGAARAEDCTDRSCTATDTWPDQRGSQDRKATSDSLATHVKGYTGTIGYAEYAFAIQFRIPVARIRNQAGNYVFPTACNQAIALTRADRNPDGTYNLDRVYSHPHASAYPISSYNYVIVPTTGSDAAKGEVMSKFILYSITDGQNKAEPLGYSPLPTNLIKQGFNVLGQVPGHPAIPGNPEKWGQIYESLTLPDGTKCGNSGKSGNGGGPVDGGGGTKPGGGGGGGGADGGGGAANSPSAGPSATNSAGPGATAGPGGPNTTNAAVSPAQAAAAASNVANIARSAGVPWPLYVAVTVLLGLVFLPAPIVNVVRRRRRD